jgi:hypothetical protein
MKVLRHAAVAAMLAALLPAQSLTTLFAGGNGGSAGWMNFFDLQPQVAVTLTAFDLNLSAALGTPGTIDVYVTAAGGTYVGNQLNSAPWTLASSSAQFTSNGAGVPTNAPLNTPITLLPGGTYGIGILYNGVSMSYTNGNGTNQTASNAEMTLTLGSATSGIFTGSLFDPRVWNGTVYYQAGSGFARAVPFGSSCGEGGPENLYELFTTNNDLSNYQGLNAIWTGSSYVIVPGASPIVAPTGSPLALTDDSTLQVALPWAFPTQRGSTNDAWVCSNGWVALETTTAVDLAESVAGLLSGPARIACLWDDLNPAAGGGVHAEVDPNNPGKFHITYLNVPEFGQSNSNTVQLSLDASGNWELKFGAIAILDGLVGYSQGNGVGPSGAVDISALNAPVIFGDGRPAPSLISIARPVIGQTATTQTNDIPTAIRGAFHLYSFNAIPNGLDLTGAGAPGCFLLGTSEVDVGFSTAGGTAQHSLAIPADNSLIGANFYSQSVMLAPSLNGLGVILTNGIRWTFDVN